MDFSNYSTLLLFIITLICCIVSGNYKAYYVKARLKNESEYYLLNAGISLVCAVSLFVVSGFDINISTYSLLLGILFGLITMVYAILNCKAIKIGPYGYTTVIINLSTAITALSGAIFWSEELSVNKIIGIVLIVFCFYFAVDTKNTDGKKTSWTWFILSVICLFMSSSVGIMQKIHQTSEHKSELMPFLTVSFLIGTVSSFAYYLLLSRKEKKMLDKSEDKISIIPLVVAMLIIGIGVAGNNALNLYLSGVVDSAIFFPIANGVPLLASLIVSLVLFKERLKKRQICGLIIGIVAIALLLF